MAAESPPTVLSWPDVVTAVDKLAGEIRADGTPQVLVGVLRGGTVPAILLAHILGVRTVRTVEVVHTAADGVDAAKTAAPRVSNERSLGRLAGMDVLVVDDIAGSGETIAQTVDLVRTAGAASVRTAACMVNLAMWRQALPPEQVLTYLGAVVQGWVIFPWEVR